MSDTTRELKQHLERQRDLLKTLGDEIRVKIHLAGMEAKDTWAVLSREAEKISREMSAEARDAIDDLAERMRRLAKAIETPDKDGGAKS